MTAQPLLTMEELARRLGGVGHGGKKLAQSTVYAIVQKAEAFCGHKLGYKPSRQRLFSEADYAIILESVRCDRDKANGTTAGDISRPASAGTTGIGYPRQR